MVVWYLDLLGLSVLWTGYGQASCWAEAGFVATSNVQTHPYMLINDSHVLFLTASWEYLSVAMKTCQKQVTSAGFLDTHPCNPREHIGFWVDAFGNVYRFKICGKPNASLNHN